MLRLRLLGEFSIELEGVLVDLPESRRARALLAWLALHPGLQQRSELAPRFWPEVLDASARASLRTAVWALRRALGPAGGRYLVTDRDHVGLIGEDRVWVDVRAVDELIRAGELDRALELCRGELLPGLEDDWVYELRDLTRERVSGLLARLAADAEQAGDLGKAIELSRRRARLDPLAEEPQRELIRLLAATGDRGAALTEYTRLRERFRTELGIPPSEGTRRLIEELLGEPEPEPAAPPAVMPLPATLAMTRRTPFVGRRREGDRLAAAWERVLGGERAIAVLSGEAGIGKTRLLTELARGLHESGALVLYGRCEEQALLPYEPFAQALRHYALSAPLDELRERVQAAGLELARVVPEIGRRLPRRPDARSSEPATDRYRLFHAVASLLGALSRSTPVAVVLEDLHWADRSTLLMLRHLVGTPEEGSLLIVATYREGDRSPDGLEEVLADLRRERPIERVVLRGLEDTDVATLIEAWSGSPPKAKLVRRMQELTAGNPFFLEELLGQLDTAGVSQDVRTPDDLPLDQLGIPAGARDAIRRRLSGLSPEALRVLSVAAVIGPEFDLSLLERAVGLPLDSVLEALDAAAATGIVGTVAARTHSYAFSHALLRESLYEGLTPPRRLAVHGEVAGALEDLYAASPEPPLAELARHLLASAPVSDVARGVSYARRAAERAMAALAYEEASVHYRVALDALETTPAPDASLRCELFLGMGSARAAAGELGEARGAFGRAAELARELGSAEHLARAGLGFGGTWTGEGTVDQEVVGLLEEALASLPPSDIPLRARLLARLAMELHFADEAERRRSLSRDALAMARRTADTATLAVCLDARHWSLLGEAGVEERRALAEELVELTDPDDEPVLALQAHQWRLMDLLELGDTPGVDHEIERCQGLADALRMPYYRSVVAGLPVMRALFDGRFPEAERGAREALELARAVDNRNGVLGSVVQLLLALRELGRPEEPLELIEEEGAPVMSWRAVLALHLLEAGREGEARAVYEPLARQDFRTLPANRARVAAAMVLAEVCSGLRDAEGAAAVYELLRPYERHCLVSGRAVLSMGSTLRYMGLLAATCGNLDRAIEHFDAALAMNERIGARAWVAHTARDYAAALLARGAPGDPDRAGPLLERGRTAAGELGMCALEERLRAAAAQPS